MLYSDTLKHWGYKRWLRPWSLISREQVNRFINNSNNVWKILQGYTEYLKVQIEKLILLGFQGRHH